MNVCMFSMLMPAHVTGGMENHALDLAKGLVEAGHKVAVVTSRHPGGAVHETISGVEVYYTDAQATSRRPLSAAAFHKFEELHRVVGFDIVHSQSGAAYHYVGPLKDMLRIPLVTTLHGTSHGEIRSILNQGLGLMSAPRILLQMYTYHRYAKRLVRGSDRVIAISRELSESIPGEFGVDKSKVRTVYNGIDTETFRPSATGVTEAYPGERLVLSVSVLHKQKGIQYLIQAMKKVRDEFPKTCLLVIGDGPYRLDLERLAARLGLADAVTFAGKVDNSQLWRHYNAASVFAIPTVRIEGLPLIALEAMACGRPVVASNIGGIPTVIRDGVNGLLANPGDSADLAGKITSVLSDETLAETLGKNARKTIEDGFSREKMVSDTVGVYREVIG